MGAGARVMGAVEGEGEDRGEGWGGMADGSALIKGSAASDSAKVPT